jgi:hypothetical protein
LRSSPEKGGLFNQRCPGQRTKEIRPARGKEKIPILQALKFNWGASGLPFFWRIFYDQGSNIRSKRIYRSGTDKNFIGTPRGEISCGYVPAFCRIAGNGGVPVTTRLDLFKISERYIRIRSAICLRCGFSGASPWCVHGDCSGIYQGRQESN